VKEKCSKQFCVRVFDSGEQGVDEGIGLEEGEVFGFFAHADIFHRQAELLPDRDDHVSLAVSIFVSTIPVHFTA
jgi:hypothetical protein